MLSHSTALLVLLLANASYAHSKQADAGPSATSLPKVLEMIEGMKTKGEKDMKDEEVEFAKFTTSCEEDSKNLATNIAQQADEIETANAKIGVKTQEVEELTEDIASLASKAEADTADLGKAQNERNVGHVAYLAESRDYSESVEALGNALTVLQRQNYDRTGDVETSLLQLSRRRILPPAAQSAISSFLASKNDNSEEAPPEANAYEFQSQSIIDTLKRLSDEFQDKLNECQKSEMNAQNNFQMVAQDLRASIELAKASRAEKIQSKMAKLEAIAMLQKMVDSTEATKAEDEKNLKDLGIECREKSESYVQKAELRRDEIAALSQAIEILGGKEVTTGAKTLSLAATKSNHPALVQVREASRMNSPSVDRQRARDYLTKAGQQLHSEAISLLAQKLQQDPFADVKKLVTGMITKLLNKRHEEAQKHGFCTLEMGKNKITRDDLTMQIDRKKSHLDETKADLMLLSEEIATLTKEVGNLQNELGKASIMREEETIVNNQKIQDATLAGKAVESATLVLKEFYEKATTGATLEGTQLRSKYPKMGTPEWEVLGVVSDPPVVPQMKPRQTFGGVYTGQQDMAGGVVALLEVIASDFATVVTSTKQAEFDATEIHKEYTKETNLNMAVKEESIRVKGKDRVEAEGLEAKMTAELKALQMEMAAAEDYYKNLVPQCLEQGTTFEERVKQIKDEIKSLELALDILGNAEGEPIMIR